MMRCGRLRLLLRQEHASYADRRRAVDASGGPGFRTNPIFDFDEDEDAELDARLAGLSPSPPTDLIQSLVKKKGSRRRAPPRRRAPVKSTLKKKSSSTNCFGSWSGWGGCSKSCGRGTRSRSRKRLSSHVRCSLAKKGGTTQTASCNPHICPSDCYWQAWSGWGACTKTCIQEGNFGYKTRTRGKVGPFGGGKQCSGHSTDDNRCNEFTCPSDCVPNAWELWSACSKSCDDGFKTRKRDAVAASNGGKDCGQTFMLERCATKQCPYDCTFSEWGGWGPCSKTCKKEKEASGIMIRVRDKNGPFSGGKSCVGPVTSTLTCNDFNCPIDCSWDQWGEWATCTKTCGTGARYRSRAKIEAKFGGAACDPKSGGSQMMESCNTKACPVNCKWTEWGRWMPCPLSCGSGHSHRARSYDPHPSNGGVACKGAHMELVECNTHHCPINCVYEDWLDWGLCSQSCAGGMRTRLRLVGVEANFGGASCADGHGSHMQEEPCMKGRPCPEDARWGEWSEWGPCDSANSSSNCGDGTRTAERVLLKAVHGGINATPEGSERKSEHCTNPCAPTVKASARPLRRMHIAFVVAFVLISIGSCPSLLSE